MWRRLRAVVVGSLVELSITVNYPTLNMLAIIKLGGKLLGQFASGDDAPVCFTPIRKHFALLRGLLGAVASAWIWIS